MARAYLQKPLGSFYANPSNRPLVYYRLGLFLLLAVMAGETLMRQNHIIKTHLAFYFTHTLHLALAYLLGLFLAELAVRWLCPHWSAYERRTVARQWLIWSLGFGLGLLLYRVPGPILVPLYAPWLITFLKHSPHIKPSDLEILLFCAAVWAVATFAVIQSALRWQRQLRCQEEDSPRPLAAKAPDPAPAAVPQAHAPPTPAAAPQAHAPPAPACLSISHDGRTSRIPVARITHVTVEDHYCRIHYLDAQGPCNLFACVTLKSLVDQLPAVDFVQIHRSHLVNLRQVGGLDRKEGQNFAVLPAAGAELPISRRRWQQLRERLSKYKSDN